MKIITQRLRLNTQGNRDVIDLTSRVAQGIKQSGLEAGVVTVFVVGSTAGVTTIENEPGLISDFKACLERIVPQGLDYQHNRAWGDGNAHSHLRASLWGASLGIPFEQGHLLLGTWQQIVLVDFDTRPRSREIVLQIMGE